MGVHPMLEKERDAYINLRGEGWKNPGPNTKYTKFGQLSIGKIICTDCHQMSHFMAKMHQIRFFCVCPFVCLSVSTRTIGWTDVSVCLSYRAPRSATSRILLPNRRWVLQTEQAYSLRRNRSPRVQTLTWSHTVIRSPVLPYHGLNSGNPWITIYLPTPHGWKDELIHLTGT